MPTRVLLHQLQDYPAAGCGKRVLTDETVNRVRIVGVNGVEAVEEACARALELDVIDIKRIESMLARGLEQRRNVTPLTPPLPRGEVLRFERPASAFSLTRETP
jgi:hypothetical protein